MIKFCAIIFTFAICLVSRSVSAAQYIVSDLYTVGTPPGNDAGPPSLFSASAGGQVVGVGVEGGFSAAVMFSPANPSGVRLSPPVVIGPSGPFGGGWANGTDGSHQVGAFGPIPSALGGGYHAALWSGTSDSIVDLNPAPIAAGIPVPWFRSVATAVSGGVQVGFGAPTNSIGAPDHALMWTGTPESVVDLSPAGFSNSEALGVNGTQQVGFAQNSGQVAFLWNGTAVSAVNLNPAGFLSSFAVGTDGTTHQVGYGTSSADAGQHALLWSGTAASVVDLGLGSAYAINDGKEVGADHFGNAIVWSGSAATAINLSALLPAGFSVPIPGVFGGEGGENTYPLTIDANGNIFGFALNGTDFTYHVFEWSPVPEPSSAVIGISAAVTLLLTLVRRRVCRVL